MKNIVVMSGKGGVGKSTISTNLAASLSDEGKKVGILDSDFHGPTIPKLLGIKSDNLGVNNDEEIEPVNVNDNLRAVSIDLINKGNESPVIWRGPLKMNVIKDLLNKVNWGDLDYRIVDLPPGTGDEPLSIAQEIEDVDGSVIVTTPQDVSVQSVRKSIKFSQQVDMPILGLIENMSNFICPNCGSDIDIFGSGGGEKLASEFDIPFLGSVPLDPEIVESGEKGKPFVNNGDKSSISFNEIVKKIKKQVDSET